MTAWEAGGATEASDLAVNRGEAADRVALEDDRSSRGPAGERGDPR
jgi:hypothetical protein